MADILFVQYLRPNGTRTDVVIDRPKPISDKAWAVIEAGGQFEAEALPMGMVSFECINTNIEEDEPGFYLATALCLNGPEVPGAVDRLVEEAYERLIRKDLEG
jgi:hypothetical protein